MEEEADHAYQGHEADETPEILQSLMLGNLSMSEPDEENTEKDFLLSADRQVRRMTSVFCNKDPVWVLFMLEKHAPHLQVLELHDVRSEHLRAALRMPQLQKLRLKDWRDEEVPRETTSCAKLRKLDACRLPWRTVAALLSAHRSTLETVKIYYRRRHSEDSEHVPLESLPLLRKVCLVCEKRDVPDGYVEVLNAARLSLEDVDLYDAPVELVQATRDMPRLQKMEINYVQAGTTDEQLRQQLELGGGQTRLRSYTSNVHPLVTLEVLRSHRDTLEEVTLLSNVSAEHLQVLRGMPRLVELDLCGWDRCDSPPPEFPETDDAVPQVTHLHCKKTRGQLNSVYNETVLSLISLFAGSLVNLQLSEVNREVLQALTGLPHLRFLEVHHIRTHTVPPRQSRGMQLEYLKLRHAPYPVVQYLLAASRNTLQEVVLRANSSIIELLGKLQVLMLMQSLRSLNINSFSFHLPLNAARVSMELIQGFARLRELKVDGMPQQIVQSLLKAHCHTLEHVVLHRATREQLQVSLRMPELCRLKLIGVHKAASRLYGCSGAGGLRWLQLSEDQRGRWHHLAETLGSLFTAHHHSLRHLVLDVRAHLGRGERWDAEGVWPSAWAGLHLQLRAGSPGWQGTVTLNRSCDGSGARCRQQVAAVAAILPRAEVRCAECCHSKRLDRENNEQYFFIRENVVEFLDLV